MIFGYTINYWSGDPKRSCGREEGELQADTAADAIIQIQHKFPGALQSDLLSIVLELDERRPTLSESYP